MSKSSKLRGALSAEGEQDISSARIATVVVLVVAAVAVAFPLYWMVATSLKHSVEIGVFPPHVVPP